MRTPVLMAISLVSAAAFAQPSAPYPGVDWKDVKGSHFIVYYVSGSPPTASKPAAETVSNDQYARDVLHKAEGYYTSIADDLGYARYTDFWTWDDRAKIYIFPDFTSYRRTTGEPDWSKGIAQYKLRTIASYRWNKEEEFLNALLPHELGHLMFRDFVGFKSEVPLWLDEGVAQWQEPAKRAVIPKVAWELLDKGRLIPLKELTSVDSARLLASRNAEAVNDFYKQSTSLVVFMVGKYGKERFRTFCLALKDGKGLDQAFKTAYSPTVETFDDLEKIWLEEVRKNK